jgi:hypothetical protein
VHVEERQQTPLGGQTMGTIYEVDFTSLPDQSLTAPGSYTIDGLTWWAKVALTGQPFGQAQENKVVAGSGLMLRSTQSQGTRTGTNGDLAYRHLFLPFANVPGYNAEAPLLMRWHTSLSAGYSNEHQMAVGLCSTTSDATRLLAAARQYDHFMWFANANGWQSKRGISSGTSPNFPVSNVGNREAGIFRFLGDATTEVIASAGNSWAGSFLADTNTLKTGSTLPVLLPAKRPNPGVFVALEGQVDTTPIYLTHLQILQPKVAL